MIDSTWVQVGTLAVVTVSAVSGGVYAVIRIISGKFTSVEDKMDSLKEIGQTRHEANIDRFARLEAKLEIIARNGRNH